MNEAGSTRTPAALQSPGSQRHTPASLLMKGFCMGTADVVPGVSGGTMAFILGIYAPLLNAIRSFDLAWFRAVFTLQLAVAFRRAHFHFVLPLVAGIFAALMFFTRVIALPDLIESHPELIYGLFFGLVVGSIAYLLIEARGVRVRDSAGLAAGILIGYLIVTAVPVSTPETWWFVTLSGMCAICAMILPGISGAFVLLILGKYSYVLDALGNFDFAVIVPFAAGAAVGLMSFARVLLWLLGRHGRQTFMVITGFLVASLWVLWPFQERVYVLVRGELRLIESTPILPAADTTALFSFLLLFAGAALVMGLEVYSRRLRRGP